MRREVRAVAGERGLPRGRAPGVICMGLRNEPWVHYVPVGRALEDVVERVQWANAHPAGAADIGAAGAAFARQHLTKYAVACYWWQLLTEFAALQSFKARSEGFSRPV